MIDDGQRLSDILTLQGVAFLTVIDVAISQGQFKKDSKLRNLGLVLGLLIKYAKHRIPEIDEFGEAGWTQVIVRLADKHGVEIKGPWGIEKDVESIRDALDPESEDEDESEGRGGNEEEPSEGEDSEDEYGNDVRSWKRWNWKREVSVFLRSCELSTAD